ncbi:hypothetical protein [Streptomyces sp. 2A115]|uniref:hypothetical protein n=1 Tax=Streptomyces sp. 2A115 TaxID=3457439 RepID=UPI003FD1FF1E
MQSTQRTAALTRTPDTVTAATGTTATAGRRHVTVAVDGGETGWCRAASTPASTPIPIPQVASPR